MDGYAIREVARDDLASNTLADLTMPVTLMFGKRSLLADPDERERIASEVSECFVIEGGHHLTIEAPDQVAAAIFGASRIARRGRGRE